MNSYHVGSVAHAIALRAGCWGNRAIALLALIAMLAAMPAAGQMNGTYTIGGASPSYASIDAAIAALNVAGVSGPVTFRIRTGTYTAMNGGYRLRANPGMSATNTVTFKPDAGASVTIFGTTDSLTGIFTIDGGKYYVIDGSNAADGTSRDMLIRQERPTTNPAVWLIHDADHNVVKNCVLVGAGERQSWSDPDAGQGVVGIGPGTATAGNDSNLVENNRVGDTSGTHRSNIGIAVEAPWNSGLNRGNRILNNDVVNFGRSNGPYSIGILVGGADDNTLVEGNEVHMSVRAPAPYLMGIAIAASSGVVAPGGTVINANRIHHLTSTWDGYSAYAILEDLSNSGGDVMISNNMISLVDDGDLYLAGVLSQGFASTVNIYYNSIYIGGTAPSRGTRHARGIIENYSNFLTSRNNIIQGTRTGGNALNCALYIVDTTNYVSDYNIINFNTGARYYTAYLGDNTGFGGVSRLTFNDFQTHTSQDQHSFEAPTTFADAANGDLHVDTGVAYTNGNRGMPLSSVAEDFDHQLRDAVHPDIGADEAGAMGIRLVYPNGGQKIGVDDTVNVAFTVNRAMSVRADISTNGGATWALGTPRDVLDSAVITLTAPGVVTARGRIRVVNMANMREADTSDQDLEIVQPVFTIVTPNGGNTLVPGDVARIEFTARYLAANTPLRLDYSVDNGATWAVIDTNTRGVRFPANSSYDWLVPNVPTTNARIRVMKVGTTAGDTSNAAFAISEMPSVALTAPAPGAVAYVGEKIAVNWRSVQTSQVRLAYSTDDGATWMNVVPDGSPRTAANGTYGWTVPNTPSEHARIRITNAERSRFTAEIGPFAIRRAVVNLLAPNGGGQYEPGVPITVTWSSANTGLLRLDYSNDNARTWRTVATGITPDAGSVSFTPPSVPTRYAFVRLVDPARQNVSDASDSAFEVLPERTITILSPTAGDAVSRNMPATIVWGASRIAHVDIAFTTDDGEHWQDVATNVSPDAGGYAWDVPDVATDRARIRISESGGGIVAISGQFAIVTRAPIAIRVLVPNGGEAYHNGDAVAIRWSASSIETPVEVAVSSDGGATWNTLGHPLATLGSFNWKAAGPAGNAYRVRVGTGNIVDESDAHFSMLPVEDATIDLIAPNGGERLVMGSTTEIRWNARNVGVNVAVEFSADGGTTWSPVKTVLAATGALQWDVPAVETEHGLIRIVGNGGSDVSAAPFAIVRPAGPITVLSPNGGERWLQNAYQVVRWNAIVAVNLEYSVDAGATWASIATGIASGTGANEYLWRTPVLGADASGTVLVRIADAANPEIADTSDAPFSLLRVAGVGMVAGERSSLAAYPNPFAERSVLRWRQAEAGNVAIRLYDHTGQAVGTFDAGHREPGSQQYELRGDGLANGMYIVELRTAGHAMHSAVIVVR